MVKERLFLVDDVIGSTTTYEFYGWPPTCSPLASCNLFLLSSASQPPAGNWPVPWTVWVDPTFAVLIRASKAFMSFLAGASLCGRRRQAAPDLDGPAVDDLNVEKRV